MAYRTVLIVQARLGSSRLPGKVLLDLCGRPMLAQQLRRLRECQAVSEIVVATTDRPQDTPIVELSRKEEIRCFRGSESDVLARFVGAARDTHAEAIVRVTADCPLIDAAETDRVVLELTKHESACDYASNVLRRTYPRGLDVEAFFADTLYRLNRLATTSESREHVTSYIRGDAPDLFLVRSVEDTKDNSDLRWTVDTESDLSIARSTYEALDLANRIAPYAEVLAFARSHPDLFQMNQQHHTWDPTVRH